jgi:hypothetical protein
MSDNSGVMNERETFEGTHEVRVRRAPRIPVFLIIGGALGALATLILASLYPTDPKIGFGTLVGYLMLFGVPAGVALGGIVAIVIDLVTTRRARVLAAERSHADAVPEEVEGEIEP